MSHTDKLITLSAIKIYTETRPTDSVLDLKYVHYDSN